jgi:hypothetical protein
MAPGEPTGGAQHMRVGVRRKVAAPATLLTDRPTPEDTPAQPPALGAILRDEGAGRPSSPNLSVPLAGALARQCLRQNSGSLEEHWRPKAAASGTTPQEISEVVSTRMETRGSRLPVLPVGWK